MSHKILINAAIHPDGTKLLEEAGFRTVIVPETDLEATGRELPDAVGMVANALYLLDDAAFARAPQLKVIGRMGVGYDNVDVAAAARRGIKVCNTPLPIIEPVAEHTFMLFLAMTRRLLPGERAVRSGGWRGPDCSPGPEMRGKTIGLVGFGNTGRRVAEIARHGFQMAVRYFDAVARPEAERDLGAKRGTLEEVLAQSDFISVHVALTPQTRGLLGTAAFAAVKQGAYFVNLSRGPVVDEAALVEALRSGRLAAAGLDVFAQEPPPRDHPLLSLPNVVLTPHVGGGSTESKHGCSMVAKDVVRVLRGEAPVHSVN